MLHHKDMISSLPEISEDADNTDEAAAIIDVRLRPLRLPGVTQGQLCKHQLLA